MRRRILIDAYKLRRSGNNSEAIELLKEALKEKQNTSEIILDTLRFYEQCNTDGLVEFKNKNTHLSTECLRIEKPVIVFFPDYSYSNPYQTLLYRDLENDFNIISGDINTAKDFIKKQSKVYFHIHWLNFIFKENCSKETVNNNVTKFIESLLFFKDLGGKIIWTIHNKFEHNLIFKDIDFNLRQKLCNISDVIHMHDQESYDTILKIIHIPERKLVIHPHGNYINYYGKFNFKYRRERIESSNKNVLYLGQIRDYKGLSRLISIATKLSNLDFNITIAGKPESQKTKELIEENLGKIKNISLILEHLSNDLVHNLLSNNEFGLLSYNSIFTSGSLRLFQSYGVVPICPKLPLFNREVSKNGYLYDNSLNDIDKVLNEISNTSKFSLLSMAKENYIKALENDWSGTLHDVLLER